MDTRLIATVERTLSAHYRKLVEVKSCTRLGGGSINHAFRVTTSHGINFLKYNDKRKFPGMFESEARGLRLLGESAALHVPEVIAVGEDTDTTFLLLEFLDRGKTVPDFREDFGRRLGVLHRCTNDTFGLDHDNYMGSLPQNNSARKNYVEFFIANRLQPQLEMAITGKSINAQTAAAFERMYKRLPEIIPSEAPALVHGDLWSGNFMIGPDGKAWLIDPAVHYGHRETDIAMSKLFGGFDDAFYKAYHSEFPLEKGWEERVDIFNLYPLLVHVNLFGGGYVQQVEAIAGRF